MTELVPHEKGIRALVNEDVLPETNSSLGAKTEEDLLIACALSGRDVAPDERQDNEREEMLG